MDNNNIHAMIDSNTRSSWEKRISTTTQIIDSKSLRHATCRPPYAVHSSTVHSTRYRTYTTHCATLYTTHRMPHTTARRIMHTAAHCIPHTITHREPHTTARRIPQTIDCRLSHTAVRRANVQRREIESSNKWNGAKTEPSSELFANIFW